MARMSVLLDEKNAHRITLSRVNHGEKLSAENIHSWLLSIWFNGATYSSICYLSHFMRPRQQKDWVGYNSTFVHYCSFEVNRWEFSWEFTIQQTMRCVDYQCRSTAETVSHMTVWGFKFIHDLQSDRGFHTEMLYVSGPYPFPVCNKYFRLHSPWPCPTKENIIQPGCWIKKWRRGEVLQSSSCLPSKVIIIVNFSGNKIKKASQVSIQFYIHHQGHSFSSILSCLISHQCHKPANKQVWGTVCTSEHLPFHFSLVRRAILF